MSRIEKSFAKLFLLSLATILTFLAIETLTNVYLIRFAGDGTFIRYASLHQLQTRARSKIGIYTHHRYLGYYPTPNYVSGNNRHNSLGYRGEEIEVPKPAGRFRIVCLGGSTTYTGQVDDYKKSYPALLEDYLKEKGYENVDVVNAGASGWSSWESLINLELRVQDLDPDLIVVYHAINDVLARFVSPTSAYRGDNSGRRAPNHTSIFMPSVFEYSSVLRIAMITAGMKYPHAAFERNVDILPETYVGQQFRDQITADTYPDGLFNDVSAEAILEKNSPIYFERNMRNIINVAKNNEMKVMLSSFAYSPLFTEHPSVSSQEFVSALEEHNRLLERIADTMDVPFLDFSNLFPNERRLYVDGQHVNEEGAQLKADLFGSFIIDRFLRNPHRL